MLRMLENEHLLTVGWSLDGRQYQLANGHLAAALRHLGKSPVFSQHKLDTAARIQVAESAMTAGELALAQYHTEEALKSVNPEEIRCRADVLSLLGNIEYQHGQADLAEKSYRNAAELREQLGDQPEVGRLFGAIGCIHARQKEYVKALEELQLAVTRSPSDLRCRLNWPRRFGDRVILRRPRRFLAVYSPSSLNQQTHSRAEVRSEQSEEMPRQLSMICRLFVGFVRASASIRKCSQPTRSPWLTRVFQNLPWRRRMLHWHPLMIAR